MVGTTLGQYRIETLLGSGGMGIVYRAFDAKLHRAVAIKLLQAGGREEDVRAKLLKEARSASALNHAAICTIYEVGELEGRAYIVMEFVEGQPLSRLIPVGEGLSLDQTLLYATQIADGLAHAHDRGVVHRDLKCANVVVGGDGRVKILDFGVARRLQPLANVGDTQTVTASEEVEIAGTPRYMAPEVLQGRPADARSDVWALGVVLHEMVSGTRPFDAGSTYEVASAILRDPPASLPSRVPGSLRSIIGRCLAKDPDQRYQRASEIKAALDAIVRDKPERLGARFPLRWATVGIVVVGALIAGLAWPRLLPRPGGALGSIAVLPLTRTPAEVEVEYLTDGIAEGVTNRLAEAGGSSLKVIALASMMRYKGQATDVREVGHRLGVDKITLLRVAQLPEGFSISAELVKVEDGAHIWGEQYNTGRTNLAAVQSDIASRVAEALQWRLTGAQRQRLAKRYTDDIEAYQLYLQGRQLWYSTSFGPDAYEKSLDFYQRAIARDPSYTLAYTGIANTYYSMGYDGWLPSNVACEKAKEATDKALALDPDLAESYYSLAQWHRACEWNAAGAWNAYERMLALNPNFGIGRRYYAMEFFLEHRADQAISEMKKVLELDPLGVETNKAVAGTFYWAGKYEDALKQGRRTLEIDPQFAAAHQLLADVYAHVGSFDDAIAEQETVLRLAGENDTAIALRRTYDAQGYEPAMRGMYLTVVRELNEVSKSGWVSPIAFAIAYAKLGERDHAFEWLEKAYAEHATWLTFLTSDPDFETLRSDPRFKPMAHRIGLR